MKKILIFSVMVLLCFVLNAQNKITGTITGPDGLSLPGTTIYIHELNKGAIADATGKYSLVGLPNGKVKIQFSFVGYANKIETVVLNGTELVLNVALQQSVIEAEEIVVTGGYNSTQHENAVKIDVLKLNSLSNSVSPNFTALLTKVPGVDMISKGSGVSKPVIRGLSMNDILVLNNGVRFENYQYSSHHPLGIDEFGIDDVEIIKGPASLLYGSDAIGGVVNFIKEKPAPTGTLAGDYNLQMFSNSLGLTQNLGVKGAAKNVFGGIRIGQKTNADYLQGGGDYVPNSRFNEYSVKANAGYSGKMGTFRLYFDHNNQKLGLVEEEAIDEISERGRRNSIFYQQLNTNMLSSQNKVYLGSLKLDVNAAYQNTELIHFGEANVYEIQMKLATLTYETKLYLPSDEKSEYIIGFQGMNQRNTNLNDRETKLLPDATTNNYSAFGLLQRTFFNKLKMQAGIRYDSKKISTTDIGLLSEPDVFRPALGKTYGSFSGSLGATLNVSEKLLFRANLATAYRTPNLAELTSKGQHETRFEVGDNALVPENSYETDLSMHYHRDNFTIDLAWFYNRVNHFIYISPTGSSTADGISIYKYMQNNSTLTGGEAGLHIHPKHLDWLHFETTFSTVVGKQQSGDYLPFIPANKLKFDLRAEKETLLFVHHAYISANFNTAFAQNNAAPDETSTKGYSLLSFAIGGKIKVKNQHIAISLSADNVLDKKYIDHLSTLKEVSLYNPGRNFALSLKIPFQAIRN
jgi:iron complex outermembrane recepter protein